jgi:hypothetical protein
MAAVSTSFRNSHRDWHLSLIRPFFHTITRLRNLAIGALRIAGHTNIAAGMRAVGRNINRALGLLGLNPWTLTITLGSRVGRE